MVKEITAQAIDQLLPQTQCTRCGYPGCLPYAEAIAGGEADINRCPPGGTETIIALSALTGRAVAPLDKGIGIEAAPTVALIDEERCIGCTKCLPPCPVDAIVGAPRLMHTVIAELCTGCELCIAPCPVDCISMVPLVDEPGTRRRFRCRRRMRAARAIAAHNERIDRRTAERAAVLADKKRGARGT